MRTQDLPRYAELERLVSASASSALAADHAGSATARSTQVRRAALARALAAEVVEAPPSRLLALIGQALKWQQEHGVLGATGRFDLFTDNSDAFHDVEEEPPRVKANALKVGSRLCVRPGCGGRACRPFLSAVGLRLRLRLRAQAGGRLPGFPSRWARCRFIYISPFFRLFSVLCHAGSVTRSRLCRWLPSRQTACGWRPGATTVSSKSGPLTRSSTPRISPIRCTILLQACLWGWGGWGGGWCELVRDGQSDLCSPLRSDPTTPLLPRSHHLLPTLPVSCFSERECVYGSR